MFVDKSRGISVVMGEIDNKKAMDKRKKALIKEGLKYGTNCNEEEVDLNWEHYYLKVKFLHACFCMVMCPIIIGKVVLFSWKHKGWYQDSKQSTDCSYEG